MSVDMFPVALPIQQWVESTEFDVFRPQAGGATGSRDFVIDRAQPKWKVTAKTRDLFPAEIGAMKAFKSKLRGSTRYCTIYDPQTQYPAQYMPAGPPALNRATLGTAFDGHCTLGAIANSGLPNGVGRDVITIGAPYALPTGLQLIADDKVELRQGVNLLSAGEAAFTSGWTATNCVITPNNHTAPDGTTTAAKVARTATGNMFIVAPLTGLETGTWYRIVSWALLGTLTGAVNMDFATSTSADLTGLAMAATGTWARFEFLAFMPVSGGLSLQLEFNPANAGGSAGDSFYLWDPRVTQVDAETLSLHRVLDSAAQVADGSGNLTVWVEPEVPASLTAGFGGALANVYQPRGKFRILDLQLRVNAKGRARPGQCTFTALSTYN